MSDDLVKRLREHTIHLDAWGKEAIHDADIVEEAADRIEQLETQIYESIPKWKANDMQDRIEKLEDALHTIYKCCDETGNCSVVRRIVRKTLEGKE